MKSKDKYVSKQLNSKPFKLMMNWCEEPSLITR